MNLKRAGYWDLSRLDILASQTSWTDADLAEFETLFAAYLNTRVAAPIIERLLTFCQDLTEAIHDQNP